MSPLLSAAQASRLPLTDRDRERVFCAPALTQTGVERRWLNALLTGPLHKGFYLTLEPQASSRPLIITLLLARGPFAVIWRVAEIVILTFNSVFWSWPSPHILHERREAGPSLANGDTSPSVIFISRVVRVLASLTQCLPREVLGRPCETVLSESFADGLSSITPARDVWSIERRSLDRYLRPAFAPTQPVCVFLSVKGVS